MDLIDTTFVPSNLFQCFAQNTDMVKSEGRDTSGNGSRDNVRTVIGSTHTNFEYSCINVFAQKGVEGKNGQKSKITRHKGCGFKLSLSIQLKKVDVQTAKTHSCVFL
jgi:hypothetical protein